ncbi:MAG: hypothetical protein KJ667_07790, partial [Alphaproteobacteria bacterium]|nr:hypothetical protein [Alphaproteobacteria bacterium]
MVRPYTLKGESLPGLRGRAAGIVEDRRFTRFITVLILLNAVTLGLETNDALAARFGGFLHLFDVFVLGVFGD